MPIKQTIKHILRYAAPLLIRRSSMTEEKALSLLHSFSPDPGTTCVANNKLDPQYDLQIIVPAYNAEKYIAQCLESALHQDTKYSYLITVVNDGSIDRTPEIIESYHTKYPDKIEMISQKNQGLSSARNAAMKTLRGKYITFLDSDDVLGNGAVEALLVAAYKTNAEIVQGGWTDNVEFASSNIDKVGIVHHPQAPSGFPWGKLFKAEIFEHFKFPEGYWFEDTPISCILYGINYKTTVISNLVYGYRLNPEGITANSGISKRSVESYYITELCYREYTKFGVKYDERAYEYFLHQCVMNQNRTRKQPKKVQEAIFILECRMKEKYFHKMNSQKMNDIEDTLMKNQFEKFRMLTLVNRSIYERNYNCEEGTI